MVKIIVKVVIAIIIGTLLLSLGLWLLGWVSILLHFAVFAAIVAAIGYGLYLWLKPKGAPEAIETKSEYKVTQLHNQNVYVFKKEPSVQDLVLVTDQSRMSKLEQQGDVFQVENNTDVIVLDDSRQEAVKVKLKSAGKKAEGWVCRSSLSLKKQA